MKLGEKMLASALFYANNLQHDKNVFGKNPCFLRKDEARTLCSTFITLLAKEHGARIVTGGFAKDYYTSSLPTISNITEVNPGMLLIIKYAELQGGFTGHCALIAGFPKPIDKNSWLVEVVDSTGHPHGSTDSRAIYNYNGIGIGKLVLLTENDIICGYRWSKVSDKYLNKDKQRQIRIAEIQG